MVAVCLTLPGFTAAATLTSANGQVSYVAAAGEVNQLTIVRSGANFVLTESGAVAIAANAPCANVLAGVATCPAANIRELDARLGDLDDSASYDASIGAPVDEVSFDGDVGNDTLTAAGTTGAYMLGREGNDIVTGAGGDDDFRLGEGDDTAAGGPGDDYTDDGPGSDTLAGGPGRDRFTGSSTPDNADVIDGGPGSDSIDLRGRTAPLNISFNGVADDGEAGEGDNLSRIERVDSGGGNDVLSGGSEPDQLYSGDGDDVLNGGPGPDDFFAGNGRDTINGGGGADTINGGEDADRLAGGDGDDEFYGEFFDRGSDSYAGGAGIDTIMRIGDYFGLAVAIDLDGVADDGPVIPPDETPPDNAGTDIENLSMFDSGEGDMLADGGTDDILTGNDAANEIDGGGGNDRILGLGGPDALIGNAGDDQLDGGEGVDLIEGDGGADRIRSRDSGPDLVSCGSSTDILLADSLDDFEVTCDRSSTGAVIRGSKAKLDRKDKARLKVSCPASEGIDCRVKLTATQGKKILARGSGEVKSGRISRVAVKLTRDGKKRRAKKLTVKFRTVLTDAAGARVTTIVPKLVLKR